MTTQLEVQAAPDAGQVRVPDDEGIVVRDGVRIAWSRFGTSGPHVVLLPTWSIVPSRFWKAQVPFLARHYRVTTFDGRGSGGSDRPQGAAAYTDEEYAADTVAVMDAAQVDHAVLVGFSCGASWAVRTAAARPDRVDGVVAIGPACGIGVVDPAREQYRWDTPLDTSEGWAAYNKHHWLAGPQQYEDFLAFFFAQMFNEPHSTKQIEDAIAWAHEIDPQTLADTTAGRMGCDGAVCSPLEPVCAQVRCPVTVMHGTSDAIRTHLIAQRLAELTGGRLLLVDGAGHGLPARQPVLVNREIRAFVDGVTGHVGAPLSAPQSVSASPSTPLSGVRRSGGRRALFLSSPIGLGHARRDLAIADELRRLQPDLQIDWLTQDPVVRFLRTRGESVHPASAHLASETEHLEAECGEHDLDAFQAIRRMDAILVNNFMVFDELTGEQPYDLLIGDEAWDVDYFLHENPGLKRSPFAWLTDFVGFLPMPDDGPAQRALTADHNAQMIEHRARFAGVRDRSVFVGDPEDVVQLPFGPDLPDIREWTVANYDFCGYVTGIEPRDDQVPRDDQARRAVRARLGYRPDEVVCLVTVGGSGVGRSLLDAVARAVPALQRRIPGVRVVMVTGPRIDVRAVVPPAGGGTVDVLGFVPDLHDHLTACDVAVVQGGLSTCMELTALGRRFVYVPLRRHFEQNIHVRHRLERYGAGQCLEYELATDPDRLVDAVCAQLGSSRDPRPVAPGGAVRAARLIADLL